MKKIVLTIIILSSLLSLSSYALAATSCEWTKPDKTRVDTTSGDTIITSYDYVCPSGTSECSGCDKATRPTDYLCCGSSATIDTGPRFTLPDYSFQIPVGNLSTLTAVNCTGGTCSIPWISQYILAVYNYGLTVGGILAVLILMAAGLLWIVSGGDSGKITKAKQLIFGSATGLLLLVSLNIFLTTINPDLAKVKPITIDVIEEVVLADNEVSNLGDTPYADECAASRSGDFSLCQKASNAGKKPSGLTSVNGKEMDASVAIAFQKAMDCVAKKNGGQSMFVINNSWRSPATQLTYYQTYITKGKPRAALPCCSNHGSGKAIDVNRRDGKPMYWAVNDSSGLTACMNANGLKALLGDEPWHWSPSGN